MFGLSDSLFHRHTSVEKEVSNERRGAGGEEEFGKGVGCQLKEELIEAF